MMRWFAFVYSLLKFCETVVVGLRQEFGAEGTTHKEMKRQEDKRGLSECTTIYRISETWTGESIFIVYSFIISFAVPLTLIMIFYVFVILKLKTVGPKRRPPPTPSNQNLQSSAATPTIALSADRKHSADPVPPPAPLVNHLTPQQASRARDRKRSHRKVTKLVLTVITVYFVCWAPYWATQLTLIFMPHDSNHSETMLTLFLLAGCFSYSNSTMNPILYAFLSDNFKKSFLKACTCAKGQDVNAQLHMENSVFPRGKKSEKGNRKGVVPSGTSGALTGQNTGGSGASGLGMLGMPNNASSTGGGLVGGAKNLLQVPPYANKGKIPLDDDDESGESEDDEGAAILGSGVGSGCGYNGSGAGCGLSARSLLNVTLNNTPSTSTTGGINSEATQSTFIQDGVHVTSL